MVKNLKEKNERGITLIALIITIIVMLILAIATISVVLGPNGVIKKASEATEKQEIETDIEQIKNIALGYLDENTRKIKLADFARVNGTINGYEVSFTEGLIFATATKGETVILIYQDGRVIKADGTTQEGGQGSIVNDDLIVGTYYAGGGIEEVSISLYADGTARIPRLYSSDQTQGYNITAAYEYSGGAGSITFTEGEEEISYTFSFDTVGDGSNKIIIVTTEYETIMFTSNGNTGLPSLVGTYTGSYNGENYTATFTETSFTIINNTSGERIENNNAYLIYNEKLYIKEGWASDYSVSNNGNTFIYEQENHYYTITFTKQ